MVQFLSFALGASDYGNRFWLFIIIRFYTNLIDYWKYNLNLKFLERRYAKKNWTLKSTGPHISIWLAYKFHNVGDCIAKYQAW